MEAGNGRNRAPRELSADWKGPVFGAMLLQDFQAQHAGSALPGQRECQRAWVGFPPGAAPNLLRFSCMSCEYLDIFWINCPSIRIPSEGGTNVDC